jgi:DNA (cytosine-5)-methyltransferase 1
MRYLSVCSGIEAASVAWHPLGWEPVAFSEIEPFPSAVLAHRFPHVPNLGDMTKFKDWPDAAIDVLVGGTPCQSFSVAGLRKGLADPRGNLALTYLAIADKYRPEWLLWENVPGVLSSSGGRDFGSFLGGLGQLGYGFAYRVLDAQYVRVDGFGRAVPQRRRRVFVVGHSDWRRAAAVLFDAASLYGDSAPRRQAGKGLADDARERAAFGGVHASDVASTLNAAFGSKLGLEDQHINSGAPLFVAHTLRGEGFDASEDGCGRGTPIVPVAFAQNTRDEVRLFGGDGQTVGALAAEPGMKQTTYICAAHETGQGWWNVDDISGTIRAEGENRPSRPSNIIAQQWAVRRLMPVECERLQGFPDGWTDVPYRGKPASDGPRYKALGNSMAVNCMRWIGRRMEMVQALCAHREAAE